MNSCGLHARQQIDHPHGWRHKQDFAHDLCRRQRHAEIDGFQIKIGGQRLFALGILFRIDSRACGHEGDQVPDMHHADGIIERIVVDHEPRMTGAFENAHELAELDVLLDGDDVGARNHDVADPPLAQAEDVLEHPALFRRKAGFAGAHGFKNIREVRAHCARFPAEQCAQRAHEPAVTAFLRWRHRHRQIAGLERHAAGWTRTWWFAVRHGVQASPRSRAI